MQTFKHAKAEHELCLKARNLCEALPEGDEFSATLRQELQTLHALCSPKTETTAKLEEAAKVVGEAANNVVFETFTALPLGGQVVETAMTTAKRRAQMQTLADKAGGMYKKIKEIMDNCELHKHDMLRMCATYVMSANLSFAPGFPLP